MPISVISGFEAVNIPICRTKASPLWRGPAARRDDRGRDRAADEGRQRGVQGAVAAHRTASITRDGGTTIESDDIGEALENMRFAGGKPNVKPRAGMKEMTVGRLPQARKIWRATADKDGRYCFAVAL
jgi:hypothetical protein